MPLYRRRIIFSGLLCVLFALQYSPAGSSPEFSVSVPVAPRPPTLDGAIVDPIWQQGARLSLDWDISYERPASENTDVYVLADSHYLYVAFKARQHEAITATQHTNDVDVSTDDFVRVTLWPAGISGYQYSFYATPAAVHYATSTENSAFAPTWDVKAKTSADGYSVTERIPLSVLRAAPGTPWRIQFDRQSVAAGSHFEWAYSKAQRSSTDVLYAGMLIHAGAVAAAQRPRSRANLYALESSSGGAPASRFGMDVAMPITSTASVLGTLHPDYSNVEVDQQSIAPTVFARQYQEVRPFFAQGAQFYRQFQCNNCIDFPILYTPNIPTPNAGIALEGVQGRVNFAALSSFATQRQDTAAAMNFSTNDSRFGASFEQVHVESDLIHDIATYGQVVIGNGHNLKSFATVGKETGDGITASGGTYTEIGTHLYDPKGGLYVSFHDVGDEYNPPDAYMEINDVRGFSFYGYREIDFKPTSLLRNITVTQDVENYTNHAGRLNDATTLSAITADLSGLFSIGLQSGSSYLFLGDRLDGDVNQNGITLEYGAGTARPSEISYSVGRFGGGKVTSWNRLATLRIGAAGTLLVEADSTQDKLDQGAPLTQWLERVSFAYQIDRQSAIAIGARRIFGAAPTFFSPVTFVSATNLSMAYHRRAGHGEVYFVYGDPNTVSTTHEMLVKYLFYVGADKGT